MQLPAFKELYVQGGNLGLLQSTPWMVAMGVPTYSIFKGKLTPLCYFNTRYLCTVYYDKANLQQLSINAEKILSKDFNSIYAPWKKICVELLKVSKQANRAPLQPNKGLKLAWEKMVDFWKWSVFIDGFDTGLDFQEINRISKLHGISKQDVQILTTPAELSYLQKYELAVLRAAQSGKAVQQVSSLAEDFHWIKTDYSYFNEFTENEARREIENRTKNNKNGNLQRNLTSLENYAAEIEQKQKKVLASYGLKENPLWLYRNLVAWRDERKKFNYVGLYALCKYGREIMKENKLPQEMFQLSLAQEYLSGKLPSLSELKQRFDPGVFIVAFDDHVELTSGKEARKLHKQIEQLRGSEKFDLRGQSACLGRAAGKVRIVRGPEDFEKFKQGEILVAVMTRPEHVPIMKKAAGIITDEGGVTCHAAIVSRELNVPCIVGTQRATKLLKTGQEIELDAFHGLVKLIR